MSQIDYRDYEELEEDLFEKIEKPGSKPPKKTWSDINRMNKRKEQEKRLHEKKKLSEKNVIINEDD
jgi:hypothetical protein